MYSERRTIIREEGLCIAALARDAGVEHFVYTSVGSAHRETGIPHFDNKSRVEATVRALGIPSHVILHPVFFMENLVGQWFLNGDRLLAALPPTTPLQMIAVADIGKFGARVFTDGARFKGREIDLAGDEVTMPEAAAALSKGARPADRVCPDPHRGRAEEQRRFRVDARVVRAGGLRRGHPGARARVRIQDDETRGMGGRSD
jgi:uncharacterized protein YbjT (DUF2867 family)